MTVKDSTLNLNKSKHRNKVAMMFVVILSTSGEKKKIKFNVCLKRFHFFQAKIS